MIKLKQFLNFTFRSKVNEQQKNKMLQEITDEHSSNVSDHLKFLFIGDCPIVHGVQYLEYCFQFQT
jgi:hypothetical protein